MLNHTVENIHFAIPCSPRPGESGQGFLLRLAAFNGRFELKHLAQAIDYKYLSSSFSLGGDDFESFLTALSHHSDMSSEELISKFSVSLDIDDERRPVVDMRLPTPKVCPCCMVNEDTCYIREAWEYAHHTHCELHGVALVDRCPCCLEPLSWNGDIFSGCSKCGYRWESFRSIPEVTPRYQSICAELTKLELKEYLAALYQNFIFVSRPFDLCFDSFNQLPKDLFDIPALFEAAFHLTFKQEAKQNWESMRLKHFLQDEYLCPLGADSLKVLASLPYQAFDTRFMAEEAGADVSLMKVPSRQREMVSNLRKRNSNSVSDFPYQMTLTTAAKLLGVDKKSVNALVELGLISAFTGSVSSRSRFISAKGVASLIYKITEKSIGLTCKRDDLIAIQELTKGLPYFNCDLSSLVMLIVKHKCQIYRYQDDEFSIPSILINREEIAQYLEQYFTESFKYDLSRSKLQKICTLKSHQFIALKNEFGFQEERATSVLVKLNPVQVSSFFEQYVLINRWAKIMDVKLRSVVQFLKCETGIISNPVLENQDIFIYERSDKLIDSLTRYLIYHNGEHQCLALICK